jgi:reductive dehalogenase
MKLFSNRHRPVHFGPFPLERLKRGAPPSAAGGARPARPAPAPAPAPETLAAQLRHYLAVFDQFRDGPVAPGKAPVPVDDPAALLNDLKSAAYFMDASMVGACAAPPETWLATGADGAALPALHAHAVVVLVEHATPIESDNPAVAWTDGADGERSALRAGEIAMLIAGYVRRLGWAARAHSAVEREVDLEALAVRAGLAVRRAGALVNPFVGARFGLAAVTTDYPIGHDAPIVPRSGLARWIKETVPHVVGLGGAMPRIERQRIANRPTHLSAHAMERIKRVDAPTTLVLEDEVPRVPKRAAFFERALQGDLGGKAQKERMRFAHKHPFSHAMIPGIRALVPLQRGAAAPAPAPGTDDPEANARAMKSLSYWLGSDLTGICEAKPFAWFSHKEDGTPIEVKHRHAIVLLIDQGFETMEGASGDDWISGAQSMRAYLRGAEIAGVMAAHIRSLGYAAQSHSNADSEVLHIPLALYAGLGEMSRIGEMILNPFVGPRFKSAIVTTDMPLEWDRPIDFGLQDMCAKCLKCARECPCDAIAWGDKVMFNGYEIWKPDAERCVRYRVTNPHGSACGRCMKMCPYNNEGLVAHGLGLWAAIKLPFLRRALVKLDDVVGNGRRNPAKKWWFDLEIVDGVATVPKGTNKRDLDVARELDPAKQKIAYYHANMMPPPDVTAPVPVDRKAAIEAGKVLESPAAALARKRQGGAPLPHYRPTPPAGTAAERPPVKGLYQ